MRAATKEKTEREIGGDVPTNSAKETIDLSRPYMATVVIQGVADIIFHRWQTEAVDEKAASAKGSKAKRTDNVESYIYRTEDGEIAIPGEYLRQAIIHAAKFRQDPRSPRKSAMDLVKAAVISTTPLASLGTKKWDYEDRRRAVVQRQGINRTRPAMKAGWKATFDFLINLPEYVSSGMLAGLIQDAGRLIGVGDFRPTYGRFVVVKFETRPG